MKNKCTIIEAICYTMPDMISNKDESSRKKIDKLSTDKILLSAVQMVDAKHNSFPATHLDIGSGTGSLIRLLRAKFQVSSFACDYTDTLMKEDGVKVAIANLNNEKLPYQNDTFDIVTCTEVVEHLGIMFKTPSHSPRSRHANCKL